MKNVSYALIMLVLGLVIGSCNTTLRRALRSNIENQEIVKQLQESICSPNCMLTIKRLKVTTKWCDGVGWYAMQDYQDEMSKENYSDSISIVLGQANPLCYRVYFRCECLDSLNSKDVKSASLHYNGGVF